MTNSNAEIDAAEREENMLITKPSFRIAMNAISLIAVVFLYYYALPAKSAAVSGCRARLAQLELISAQAARQEADLDAKEKTLDAAEAQLNNTRP